MTKEEKFESIVKQITEGKMIPTLGYQINKEMFFQIVEIASKHICKWGWVRYIAYMELWKMKVDERIN